MYILLGIVEQGLYHIFPFQLFAVFCVLQISLPDAVAFWTSVPCPRPYLGHVRGLQCPYLCCNGRLGVPQGEEVLRQKIGVWLWEPSQRTAALPAWLDYGVYARNAAHVTHKVAHFSISWWERTGS